MNSKISGKEPTTFPHNFDYKALAEAIEFERSRLLNKHDVAKRLAVPDKVVDDLRKSGLLVAVKVGKSNCFSQEEFRRFKKRTHGEDISNYSKMCSVTRKLKEEGRF